MRDWQKDMETVERFKHFRTLCNGIPLLVHGQTEAPEPAELALEYWLQQYAAEKEQTERWREHVRQSNIDLEAAKAREQKLREAIQTTIEMKELNPEQMATDQKGLYDAAMWFLSGIMDSLYPKEETKP